MQLLIIYQSIRLGKFLVPLREGFEVHGADVFVAAFKQVGHEMAADETACSAYYYFA